MRIFFKAVSYTLHPIFMLTLAVLIFLYVPVEPNKFILDQSLYFMPNHNKHVFLLLFGVMTLLAPAISILVLRWNQIISSLEISDKNERAIPYIVILVYFCIGYYFLIRSPENVVPLAFKSLVFSAIINVFLLLILSRYIKISGHVSGISGITGVIIAYHIKETALPLWLILLLIIAIGLIATARLGLRQHNQKEIYFACLMSFTVGFSIFYSGFII